MPNNNQTKVSDEVNRRNFLRGSSVAALMAMMGGIPLKAAEATEKKKRGLGPPMKCAVIGCGQRGREILTALAAIKGTPPKPEDPPVVTAPVVALCDTYAASVRRAKEVAPNAEGYDDYKKVLANKDVKAVFIATPTHLHKQIALDAMAAGKHVYCEAPLAHTIEDARILAKAAKEAGLVNFQSGMQLRADPQRYFLLKFIREGSAGNFLKAHAQWHKKTSWRRTAPTPEREAELNWRLNRATSPGLVGENGIHQVDEVNWFFDALPTAVTGFSGTLQWKNEADRTVPDTVQAVFEYPSGASLNFEATLGNSYEGEFEAFYGSYSAIILRGNLGWLFKEVDSPMFGWEVFARKMQFYKETGIVLKVGSSTQDFLQDPLDNTTSAGEELTSALEAFLANSNAIIAGIEDFMESFGDKPKELKEHVAQLRKGESWFKAPGYREAFEANVTVVKANEAILEKKRIVFQKEWFEI
jgi:predicted dehydrogenase